jgi:drug/metabolite transporter (DMT)-like permease
MHAQWPVIRRNWRLLAVLGLLGVALFNTLSYIGVQWTTVLSGIRLTTTARRMPHPATGEP